MLISFSVGNFLSFRNTFTLSFIPDSLKEREDFLHIPYLYDLDYRLLKSLGIYGHNSHGKSNFIKSYLFFQNLILTSSNQNINEVIEIQNFQLNTSTIAEPSYFEAIFFVKDSKYRYGFKVTRHKILEEWLYYSEARVRENYLFHRVEQEIKTSKLWYKESGKIIDKAIHFTKPHQLLLSSLILSNEVPPRILSIFEFLKGGIVITDISENIYFEQAMYILSSENYRPLINRLIEKADLGFTTIINKIDSLANNKLALTDDILKLWFRNELKDFSLYTSHNVYDESDKIVDTIKFELLKNESAGTLKFLILSSFLCYAIKQGQLIIIDEIDSKFHSLLLKLIIEFYNDSKINVNGSQMIFTTHNTILLNDILRRDQILFIEKNSHGESSLKKAHSSQQPLRIASSIEKEYRKGKIGGVSKRLSKDNNQSSFDF